MKRRRFVRRLIGVTDEVNDGIENPQCYYPSLLEEV